VYCGQLYELGDLMRNHVICVNMDYQLSTLSIADDLSI